MLAQASSLRDGQSFALAGLLDNNETRSISKIPILGDIPILGNLFKSSTFQKNESELMFIVTADLVKPVNRDDLPRMKGVEELKTGSPLGIEPKGDGIQGKSGFSTDAVPEAKSVEAAPKTATPATTTVGAVTNDETKDTPSVEKTVKAAVPQALPATATKAATPE